MSGENQSNWTEEEEMQMHSVLKGNGSCSV